MTAEPASSALCVRRAAFAVAASVLAADQASKWWIVHRLMPPPRGFEITSFFNIVMVWNRGVTFGMFGMGGGVTRWILVGVTLAVVALLVVWLARIRRPWPGLALGAVIGGALGNLLDRLIYGKVTDFLDFHVFGWHWPAFNLADSAIVCGVGALLLDTFIGRRE